MVKELELATIHSSNIDLSPWNICCWSQRRNSNNTAHQICDNNLVTVLFSITPRVAARNPSSSDWQYVIDQSQQQRWQQVKRDLLPLVRVNSTSDILDSPNPEAISKTRGYDKWPTRQNADLESSAQIECEESLLNDNYLRVRLQNGRDSPRGAGILDRGLNREGASRFRSFMQSLGFVAELSAPPARAVISST
jgi:hypothetical protein